MMVSSKWALDKVILYDYWLPHIYGNRVSNYKWLMFLGVLQVVIHPARLASQSLDIFIFYNILYKVFTGALILWGMQGPPSLMLTDKILVWHLWGFEFEDLIRWPDTIRVVIVGTIRHLLPRRCATSPSDQVVLIELCDNGRLIFSTLKILLVQWIEEVSLLLINYLAFKLVY